MKDEGPPPRSKTARAELEDALRAPSSATARELSAKVGMTEKAVLEHLAHLERSLKAKGESLEIEPAVCLGCGLRFEDRKRLARPSRCPSCRSERIAAPRFRIVRR